MFPPSHRREALEIEFAIAHTLFLITTRVVVISTIPPMSHTNTENGKCTLRHRYPAPMCVQSTLNAENNDNNAPYEGVNEL